MDHLIWSLDEETTIWGADRARTGLASSQTGQLSQMQDLTTPMDSSYRANRKIYMVHPVWSPNGLIMNFGRFFPGNSSAQSA